MSKKAMPVQADQGKIIQFSDYFQRSPKKEVCLRALNLLLRLKTVSSEEYDEHISKTKKAFKDVLKYRLKEVYHG